MQSYDRVAPTRGRGTGAPAIRGGLVLLALLAAAPAAAQAPDTLRQDTVYEIEPIAVRAVRPSATTGGVSAIEVRLDSVRFRPAPLLEDILRELPLVQVRTNSRGEAQLALRGAKERQIAILLDGIPVTIGWDHRTDLSVIPMTAAQSIQLVRGMSSVLHGPNVLGGVVEVDLGAEPRGRVRPVRLAAGVDDAGGYSINVVGAADGRRDEDRWVVRAGVGRRQRDGFESARDVESVYPSLSGSSLRVNSDLDHADAFLSARYQRDGGGWVSATTSAFRAERGVPPELNDDGPRLWRYPETWRSLSVVTAGLGGVESDLGTATVEVNVGLDVGGTRIQDFAAPADPDDPALEADAFYRTVAETEDADDRTVTVRLKGTQRISGGLELRGAATYADVRHDEVIRVGLDTTEPASYPAAYRQRLWSVGTEADLPFRLGGLEPFTGGRVSAGLALDGADTPEAGGADTGPSMTEWGGRLGVSASTRGGGLLVHTAVSRRGRFPALREMYSAALGRFEPNPALRPETLTAIEAGFTSRFGDYDLQVVGFHQRLDDAIVRGAPPTGSDARYQRVNRDQVRSTGLEIMAGYTAGRFALETELTLQDVEVVEPGSPAVRAEYEPEIAGGVGGTVPLLAGIEAGAEVEYWGRQFCSAPRPGEEDYEELGPSARADAQLARTFRLAGRSGPFSRVGVELAVNNVADTAVYDQCGLPQPGRTLRLQVRVD